MPISSKKLVPVSMKVKVIVFARCLTIDPCLDEYKFGAELVETVLSKMKRGKAPGLDELTIEHLVNSHPVMVVILSKLFNLIVSAACVPH